MDISTWLKFATRQLKDVGIETDRLDAELILAATIRKARTYLHAHLDESLDPRRIDIANARLDLRKDRVPLAYILGSKEFYGRSFIVTPQVLIPRPESEAVIDLFLKASANDISSASTLVDIGTGSGALGITAKLERPNISVTLTDTSRSALDTAQKNADSLGAEVKILEQNLLIGQIEPITYIIANLPYVDETWTTSKELKYEPQQALYAKNQGLELIFELIEQAPRHLQSGGWLILEADPVQHQKIINKAKEHNFSHASTNDYALSLRFEVTKS